MAHLLIVLSSTTLAYSKEKNLLTALLLPLSPPGVQRLHNVPLSCADPKTSRPPAFAVPMVPFFLLLLHFLPVILINSLFL